MVTSIGVLYFVLSNKNKNGDAPCIQNEEHQTRIKQKIAHNKILIALLLLFQLVFSCCSPDCTEYVVSHRLADSSLIT